MPQKIIYTYSDTADFDNESDESQLKTKENDDYHEKEIRSLWNNVIIPYIKNNNTSQILNRLSEESYEIFRNFMIRYKK